MKSNNNHLQPYMRQDQNNPHKVLDFYKFHHLGLTPILLKHSLETNQWDTREFSITLRYKFNTTKSKYKGTGAANDELRRL